MVKVDKSKCIGCGNCESMCPDVFKLGSDGKSSVKSQKGKCNLKEVADSCPVQAITIK